MSLDLLDVFERNFPPSNRLEFFQANQTMFNIWIENSKNATNSPSVVMITNKLKPNLLELQRQDTTSPAIMDSSIDYIMMVESKLWI